MQLESYLTIEELIVGLSNYVDKNEPWKGILVADVFVKSSICTLYLRVKHQANLYLEEA